MRGRFERENDRKIKAAFKRFPSVKDRIIEDGMKRLMDDAMAYAISIHDAEHWGHRTTGDSYGWVLLNKGRIVALKVNGGSHGEGEAEKELRHAAGECKAEGWAGIILASLRVETDRNYSILFQIDYEIGVLEFTKDEVQEYFANYFKPISND